MRHRILDCSAVISALMLASCAAWQTPRLTDGFALGGTSQELQDPGAEAAPQEPDSQEREGQEREDRRPSESPPTHRSLDLGFHNAGLSFGNSEFWDGLRINLRDHGARRVNGVNLTFWGPHDDAVEQVDGVPRATWTA